MAPTFGSTMYWFSQPRRFASRTIRSRSVPSAPGQVAVTTFRPCWRSLTHRGSAVGCLHTPSNGADRNVHLLIGNNRHLHDSAGAERPPSFTCAGAKWNAEAGD